MFCFSNKHEQCFQWLWKKRKKSSGLGAPVSTVKTFSDLFTPWQNQKEATSPSTSGPMMAQYSLKSLSCFCPLVPSGLSISVSDTDLQLLPLTASSACGDWILVQTSALRQQMAKAAFSHIFSYSQKEELDRICNVSPSHSSSCFTCLIPSPWPLLNNYTSFYQAILKLTNSSNNKTVINKMPICVVMQV